MEHAEAQTQLDVRNYIGAMLFTWLPVTSPAERAYIERNSITLTSRLSAAHSRLRQEQPLTAYTQVKGCSLR